MRLIHTADWHLGRRLKGVDRTPEIAAALEQLLHHAKSLEVDAVLIAGDIFDVPNPTAAAERVAYQFFCGLEQANIPAVAIAGNHDSAYRIDSIANLLSLAGVRALGKPRRGDEGGAIILDTASGKLCVGAMPFASERRLLDAATLWQNDDGEYQRIYREIVSYLLQDLSQFFRDDCVNVLMAHLTIDGARLAYSEVPYYTRSTYALAADTLPAAAQYIALGHIHAYQSIPNPTPAYYPGSLIQLDFGEAQQEKGFCLVTVEPGKTAEVAFHPLGCQRPLQVIRCAGKNLEDTLAEHQYYPGFLKVIVELDSPRLGLADEVRQICPQTLQIEAIYPESFTGVQRPVTAEPQPFDPVEEFYHYYQERLERNPSDIVVEAFERLYKTMREKNLAKAPSN
jgi:DNA repair protein SbcD/Mre11